MMKIIIHSDEEDDFEAYVKMNDIVGHGMTETEAKEDLWRKTEERIEELKDFIRENFQETEEEYGAL